MKLYRFLLAVLVIVTTAWPLHSAFLRAATFTVDSNGDGADFSPLDGACNDGSGDCTLRAAIQQANVTAALDTIAFSILRAGLPVITPGSPLPAISKPAFIDATTESGGRVKLRGVSAGNAASGFRVSGGGTTIRGFIISSFDGWGIALSGAGNNRIRACYIGTGTSGLSAEGNGDGVDVNNVSNNIIGGTLSGDANVISGNQGTGIWIHGAGARGNDVRGNRIGLAADGNTGLPQLFGIMITDRADSNVIGGRVGRGSEPGNFISGNEDYGIWIDSSIGNRVLGNYIGTNVAGTAAVGNLLGGVFIEDHADGNIIGGLSTEGDGNVISGNGPNPTINNTRGISIVDANDNEVQGNIIGPNAAGTGLLEHNGYVGNTFGGILIYGNSSGNTIGGSSPGTGNLISGNSGAGIHLAGATPGGTQAPHDNVVQGNVIGATWNGNSPLPNALGIWLVSSNFLDSTSGPFGNLIGGATRGSVSNTIAFNQGSGIFSYFNAYENRFLNNSIYSNGGLGIDLDGPVPGVNTNDHGDADRGANRRQNFPILASATTSGNVTTVTGVLEGSTRTGATYTIDFYASPESDPSGHGEGKVPLGTEMVTADIRGVAPISAALPATILGNEYVTATATDEQGNTSEFSPCIVANRSNMADLEVTATDDRDPVGRNHFFYYDVVIKNHGPHEALGVFMTDSLPEGSQPFEIEMSQGDWWQSFEEPDPPDPDTVLQFFFTIGSIPPGDSVTLRLHPIAGLPGLLTTTFHVTSNFDPNASNNDATVETTIGNSSSDLRATLTTNRTHLALSDTATLTLRVINGGPDHCYGVYIDSLPTGLKLIPPVAVDTGSGWTYNLPMGKYLWYLRTSLVDFFDWDDTIHATLRVVPLSEGVLTWAPFVVSDGPELDPNPVDNQATISLTVCNIGASGTGDVNADGDVVLSDIVYLVNFVLKGGPLPLPCRASGDVNCDGAVATSDIIYLVNSELKGGPPPCDVCTLIPSTWTCP